MALLRSHAIKAEETSRVRRDLLTTHTTPTNQTSMKVRRQYDWTEFLAHLFFLRKKKANQTNQTTIPCAYLAHLFFLKFRVNISLRLSACLKTRASLCAAYASCPE